MNLIDGKKAALEIQSEIEGKISLIRGRKPGLAFILVGDHAASLSYVRSKKKSCGAVGIVSTVIELPKTIAESDLMKEIQKLNLDPAVDGILVQLPLPSHIDERMITASIDPKKDVDGFHPINVGKMLLGEEGGFLPCTPNGVHVLLQRYQIPIEGKHVVIVGRSNIVGKPLAAILMQKKPGCNATVTIAHSKSEHLSQITQSADILIAAIGSPLFIKKEMVKPGSTVIDVGINRLVDKNLVGDVDFAEVAKIAGHITPVPGGVGPMTIAMLLKNTLLSFLKLALFLCFIASCQSAPEDPCTYFEGVSYSRPYRVTIGKALTPREKKGVSKQIQQTLSQLTDVFDQTNPQSEISRLNGAPEKALVPLSPPLQEILAIAGQIFTITSGRFDPTIEPLKRVWLNSLREQKDPPSEALQEACDGLGWNLLQIQNGILCKEKGETRIDLTAIAKGFAIDILVKKLNALGYKDLLVKWGQEIRATGHHPLNKDWSVQIDPNLTVNQQPLAPIPLRNQAIATCSNKLLMIDPLTAAPVEKTNSSIASATVIAPTSAIAGSLAASALLFQNRSDAEKWAQEVVHLYPDVSFWIISHRTPCD
jgi:methylenetetrahydrofolate dehydrogenase (NADP+)/methenyltetrahydrofolate cyclohydrolase